MTEEQFEKLLSGMELEVPSMSFTRNVMNTVKEEIPPLTLKTRVDLRIIYGIAAVFIAAILVMFIYAASQSQTGFDLNTEKLNFNIEINVEAQATLLKIFLFADLIIALFYFDRFLRRKLRAT